MSNSLGRQYEKAVEHRQQDSPLQSRKRGKWFIPAIIVGNLVGIGLLIGIIVVIAK